MLHFSSVQFSPIHFASWNSFDINYSRISTGYHSVQMIYLLQHTPLIWILACFCSIWLTHTTDRISLAFNCISSGFNNQYDKNRRKTVDPIKWKGLIDIHEWNDDESFSRKFKQINRIYTHDVCVICVIPTFPIPDAVWNIYAHFVSIF